MRRACARRRSRQSLNGDWQVVAFDVEFGAGAFLAFGDKGEGNGFAFYDRYIAGLYDKMAGMNVMK